MKKCINVIGDVTGYAPLPTTKFDDIFDKNWQKRVGAVNKTMQIYGYTAEYGDFSPYFAQNSTELANIIKQYQTPYTQLNKKICKIFSDTFNIKMGHKVSVSTPLYNNNSVIYMLNPYINEYTFLQFMTRVEDDLGVKIQNPGNTTKELDTLKKWCDYIAEIKGIQIPQKRR